jgi:large subunit ribosomal protein L6
MSRIGKRKIKYAEKTTIKLENSILTISGAKGVLTQKIDPAVEVTIDQENRVLSLTCNQIAEKSVNALHGLYGALIRNMVVGVESGFLKVLELVGVGYKVQKDGAGVSLTLGYSHPIKVKQPEGIVFEVEGATKLKISGFDKELVGQIAADIRKLRKVEPYKGKGIRYSGEIVRRKVGKSVK